MGNDKKLKLIKSPEKLGRSNNFWRVCPRMLEFLPDSHCSKGKPIITGKSKRVQEEPSCQWWINSPDHNYCFWKYIHDKSSVDGVMNELVQSELANLFGWSNTKTHFILKEAIEELTSALKTHGAVEMLSEMDQQEYQDFIDTDVGLTSSDSEDYHE